MATYVMEAKENFDATRVAGLAALTDYTDNIYMTDQNYQGVQWDAVRRNLMYIYCENLTTTPTTNTTGFTLWDGADAILPTANVDPARQFNTSVGVKNIDTDVVTFYRNYDPDNLVPAGIGGGDGTWRRYTTDFRAIAPRQGGNGPGMTDPYTGNFWIHAESCQLYCFRFEDNYSQIISPLKPLIAFKSIVKTLGLTGGVGVDSWVYAREIDETDIDMANKSAAYLYLTPREFTAEEYTQDELLVYASFEYPRREYYNFFTACHREVFDHSGNMYLMSQKAYGGKDYKLYKFTQPTDVPYGGPTVGGGFTDVTPWAADTGPNADAENYAGLRYGQAGLDPNTASNIPMYLPATDELAIITKQFPAEHTEGSYDPALMSWGCTYVSDPSGTPTFTHHSAFVTGYMNEAWVSADIGDAFYAVHDAFEVNTYLNHSDYLYDNDYTKRWFFFLCTKMAAGVSDEKPRVVLVEYQFVNGAAPVVLQVIDEQGWNDAYPDFAEKTSDGYWPIVEGTTSRGVATAMHTFFNTDYLHTLWDSGIYDEQTNSFWWSGGGTDSAIMRPNFCEFDETFLDRSMELDGTPGGMEEFGTTPPFLKLTFIGDGDDDEGEDDEERRKLTVWGFNQDGHKHFVFRLGSHETLVFDRITGQWSEWRTPDLTVWRAHLGLNYQGIGAVTLNSGTAWNVIGGDDRSGILWTVDPTYGLDTDADGVDIPFTRQIMGMVPMRGREGMQCGGIYVLADLGAPVATFPNVTLETSDDNGKSYLDHGAVTVVPGDDTQEIAWIGLGLITSPGRLFMLEDQGAFARISSIDMRE